MVALLFLLVLENSGKTLAQLKSYKICQCISAPGHTINLHLSL